MSAEVTVGVIGLVGAALGAGGAVAAGWVQQWQMAKYAARERRDQRALTIGEEALLQLVHLDRELEMAVQAHRQGAEPDIADLIRRFGRDAETALLRLPGAPDLQERMDTLFSLINSYHGADSSEVLFALISGWERTADDKLRQIQWARFFTREAVATLGAFLREEKLPNPERLERFAALGER